MEIIPVKGIKDIPEQIQEASIIDNNITTFIKQKLDESIITTNTTSGNRGKEKNSTMLSNTSSIPFSKLTIKTTTYSPDISAPITGTFHIEGPFLVENNDYIIKVEVISIDGKILSEPIEDVFILSSKI